MNNYQLHVNKGKQGQSDYRIQAPDHDVALAVALCRLHMIAHTGWSGWRLDACDPGQVAETVAEDGGLG